uniref:Sister chromatid cohesion protein PDS5 homolog BAlike [Bombus terrestris] n=1 Tax=Lepeophtheirus salmonis TaxID=72036 RepID=A0A0K2UC00_LEPSM
MSTNHKDVITIVYPPGCREVTDDLGSDELIRRLKNLVNKFQNYSQAEDENTYMEFVPLANHIVDECFLNNESKDVQLLVACCIADILRMFAPEAPYKDPYQIKSIFSFLIKQLAGIKDPKNPAFKRYFYLLENLGYVKSFTMCFDLEESSEILCSLFSLFFRIINDEHSGKVKNCMLDVLVPLITDADIVPNELLDIILKNIIDPYKTQRKNAYELARNLIVKTNVTLETYIQQYFKCALFLGKVETKTSLSNRIYDLIYELNIICPVILISVLPQLEFKLKSTEESERMGSVSLLARIFSEPSSRLSYTSPQLWKAFLGRFNDVSLSIRIKCVQHTMHFLLNHEELHEDIIEVLKNRQHDPNEAVRFEVVTAIVNAAKRNFSVVADSEDLLNFVKERTMDKKFKIRKEAVNGLAFIYNRHIMQPQQIPSATKKAVSWIKNKILHGYYMPGIEDRLLVERLVNTRLVPFTSSPDDRMKKLFLLFSTIDENASKAFIEIQKHQMNVRKGMQEFISFHRLPLSEKRSRDLAHRVLVISRYLPEPLKAQEFIKKLSQHLLSDETMLSLFEKILDQDVSCSDCLDNVNLVLKKLGSPVKSNLYHGTIKQLLERISSLMIDMDAIQHLIQYVKEALENGPILQELELDSNFAAERGLKLLFVLSFVFPSHFSHHDLILKLINYLKIESDHVGPMVLAIFTFIGKHKPIVEYLPELEGSITQICKEFIRKGTPKEAKQAVKCLYMNLSTSQDVVFNEILEIIKENLKPEKGLSYRTAIVALGHIAFHLPQLYPIQIKNLVSREIVKKLLMKDNTEPRVGIEEWVSDDKLPMETICKIEGMKMMARWLLGLKHDAISAQKTFRMLNAVIENKGDLLERNNPAPAERAWLRLSAGCAMLKICEQKGVGDEYSLEQFYNLSKLMVDEVPQVREKFLIKLHKGLGRGIPHKCLPLDFMGLYALAGLDSDSRIRGMAKNYLSSDISRRREYIKVNLIAGNVGEKNSALLPKVMPDFTIVFSIPVLTHWVKYENHEDVDTLKEIQKALWFILEPLIKSDSYSFGFFKALIEGVKQHKDSLHPDEDSVNFKMWALCDLALSVLVTKTTSYELKEFPTEPSVPLMYFKSHDNPLWFNSQNYLPASMQIKGNKKSGINLLYNEIPVSIPSSKKSKSGEVITVVMSSTEETAEEEETSTIADQHDSSSPPPVFNDATNGSVIASNRTKRKRAQNGSEEGDDSLDDEDTSASVPKKPNLSSEVASVTMENTVTDVQNDTPAATAVTQVCNS